MLPPEKESNYDEDEFDEQVLPEKEFMDPVPLEKVKLHFEELRYVL